MTKKKKDGMFGIEIFRGGGWQELHFSGDGYGKPMWTKIGIL